MNISVVIPVWNGRAYLSSCLEALLAQARTSEATLSQIVAVDDASSDGAAEQMAADYPQVQLIRNRHNLGFAGSCNRGIRAATSDLVVLLNQDTQVQPGWLDSLAAAFQDPEVGIAGCKIFYPNGERLQHAGGWIEWPLGLAHHFGQGEAGSQAGDTARTVPFVTGAAMAIRPTLFTQIGLLDDEFRPGYFEDADFCLRAAEAGYRVWYTPDAQVIHAESTTLVDPMQRAYAYQRGRLRFVLKHLPPSRFLAEFLPAEKIYQQEVLHGHDLAPFRMAYLEVIPMAVRILPRRWQADESSIAAVLAGLQALYRRAWRGLDGADIDESTLLPAQTDVLLPAFQELEFRSKTPLLGTILARVRSFWYDIAARWGVRFLAQQQGEINRRLQEQLLTLAEENRVLAAEVARLQRRLDVAQEKADTVSPDTSR